MCYFFRSARHRSVCGAQNLWLPTSMSAFYFPASPYQSLSPKPMCPALMLLSTSVIVSGQFGFFLQSPAAVSHTADSLPAGDVRPALVVTSPMCKAMGIVGIRRLLFVFIPAITVPPTHTHKKGLRMPKQTSFSIPAQAMGPDMDTITSLHHLCCSAVSMRYCKILCVRAYKSVQPVHQAVMPTGFL